MFLLQTIYIFHQTVMRLVSITVISAVPFLSDFAPHSTQMADTKAIKQNQKTKNDTTDCLSAKYPERKYIISAGVMNGKAIDIPKPQYPAKVKTEKITGEVTAMIFIDTSGKVIWARIKDGHPLLQKAVGKVVCRAMFKPPTVSGIPYSVYGIVTYKFELP